MQKYKELKHQIINELEAENFPNFKFLFSDEVLDISIEFLTELLEKEKQDFENRLKLDNSKINFNIFHEESILYTFWSYLNHLNNVASGEKIRKIIEDFEPKLTEFGNEIAYSKRNFEMLEYCLENCKLDEEQNKIISEEIKSYKIRGIALEKEKQEKLKKINLELSELSTKFSNNVLDDEKKFEYFLETDEFLKEFSESDLRNAKKLAEIKGKKGYAFDSSASSYLAIMKYCSNSDIRKYFAEAHSSFASKGEFDNREIILRLIELKNKKAKILGYKNFAELSLEYKMAESPEEVLELIEDLSRKAKPKALEEIKEIKKYFGLKELKSWDMSYYSRILKEKKYKLDDKKLKQYFEFENTKKALFETVEKLYDIEMKPCRDVSLKHLYDQDIEVYKVYKDGKFTSYFMGDYFYNENKRSGAWADELRGRFEDKKSIVINTMSFVKNNDGKTLLTLGEVTTMFHEFGHAIHSMLSKSKYSDLSGFGVEWDFVELPSQIMEKWASDELTIQNVAKHYKTGEKLSSDLFEALKRLNHFGTGNFVLGQNIYGIIDMMFYSGIEFKNKEDLDDKFLTKINEFSVFPKEKEYKMYTSFSHIFAGGYSAGYYSYMWADILVDEIWAEFKKHGVYNKGIATKFEQQILGAGSIKKAKDMFEDFMGRSVSIDAFLEEKGLK